MKNPTPYELGYCLAKQAHAPGTEGVYSTDGTSYDVGALQAAAKGLSREDIPVKQLLPQLSEEGVWFGEHEKATPANVIKHMQRIQAADLGYPIILSPTGEITEGIHRLAKSVMQKAPSIGAVRLPNMPTPRPNDAENLPT